jgi:hypothetical protein
MPMHPAFQASLPPSSRRRTQDLNASRTTTLGSPRKINPGESQSGNLGYEGRNTSPVYPTPAPAIMHGIDETLEASSQPINPHNKNLTPPPPPPPPAPPILKELQHLAMPPPPPPAPLAPLYRNGNIDTHSMISGVSTTSGVIEIVMDDDEDNTSAPMTAMDENAPQQHLARNSSISQHSRGRSENDNSITGRFSRAAERLRSASRGRQTSPLLERGKPTSPTSTQGTSPYESIQTPWNSNLNSHMSSGATMGTTERHPREVKATMEMEGGMI